MIKRHAIKSCCGRKTFIFETDKPMRKAQLQVFLDKGYSAPDSYRQMGIFYVTKDKLIATGPYGSNRISIYCHGDGCESKLNSFETLLDQAVNTST